MLGGAEGIYIAIQSGLRGQWSVTLCNPINKRLLALGPFSDLLLAYCFSLKSCKVKCSSSTYSILLNIHNRCHSNIHYTSPHSVSIHMRNRRREKSLLYLFAKKRRVCKEICLHASVLFILQVRTRIHESGPWRNNRLAKKCGGLCTWEVRLWATTPTRIVKQCGTEIMVKKMLGER